MTVALNLGMLMNMDIVVATHNKKKIEEIARILEGMDITLQTIELYPDCPEVEEDAPDFRGNAVKKALAIMRHTGVPALADDSGLVVDALGGAPGVYSARYCGPGASDTDNFIKLLAEMQDVTAGFRQGRFVCVIALATPEGEILTFEGRSEGCIAFEPRGVNGFGYDPVFIPSGYATTFAEMAGRDKDSMSHRGMALKKLSEYLQSHRD